jgi:hypothetical protein
MLAPVSALLLLVFVFVLGGVIGAAVALRSVNSILMGAAKQVDAPKFSIYAGEAEKLSMKSEEHGVVYRAWRGRCENSRVDFGELCFLAKPLHGLSAQAFHDALTQSYAENF